MSNKHDEILEALRAWGYRPGGYAGHDSSEYWIFQEPEPEDREEIQRRNYERLRRMLGEPMGIYDHGEIGSLDDYLRRFGQSDNKLNITEHSHEEKYHTTYTYTFDEPKEEIRTLTVKRKESK